MPPSLEQLRRDALAIWQAGVDAVRPDRLIAAHLQRVEPKLVIGGEAISLDEIDRMVVVGGGKAGAAMSRAVEACLGSALLEQKQVVGWVNVPEGPLSATTHIHLHPARPAGINEPTPAAAAGTDRILESVSSLGPRDLCLCLLSGGGSALLPAPAEGITLEDKLAVTRALSAAGANIEQLNTVRKQLSRIKGGGLARACKAGRLVTLIISDVLGDRLDLIASGPTVPDPSTPQQALAVLEKFNIAGAGIRPEVFDWLRQKASNTAQPPSCQVSHVILANNATAVSAAAAEARQRGYETEQQAAEALEGAAEEIGASLARRALAMREAAGPRCLVTGGEPTVALVPSGERGLGGRNQQLVLAALRELGDAEGVVLLSGGTDGEDGPTDAAGAVVDAQIIAAAANAGLDPHDYLRRNDAYHFFETCGGLIKTGPTQTNVCDVRVVLTAGQAGRN